MNPMTILIWSKGHVLRFVLRKCMTNLHYFLGLAIINTVVLKAFRLMFLYVNHWLFCEDWPPVIMVWNFGKEKQNRNCQTWPECYQSDFL